LTLEESKKTTVNGMPAITTISKQVTQDQSTGATSTTKVLSYFIDYNSIYYIIHGVSVEADFATYAGTMENCMKTFSTLTDAAKINVKPNKILIKKVFRTGTLANAFAYYGVKQELQAELALLNELELTSQVQAGKLIKIIGE
jgi:predicted Zn-dependent protease